MEGHLSGYGGNTNASEVFMANDFDLELQTTHMVYLYFSSLFVESYMLKNCA
jgi:hypothetical protein